MTLFTTLTAAAITLVAGTTGFVGMNEPADAPIDLEVEATVDLVEGEAYAEIASAISAVESVQPARTTKQMRIIEQRDGRTIELTVEDGEITATHNGKKIDSDRIKKTGNIVIVLDGNGEELTRFGVDAGSISTVTPGQFNFRSGNAPGVAVLNRGDVPGVAVARSEPRLVIGVNIADVSAELRQHLNIGVPAIRIEGVYDGMPASKAGLKANDIIVSIDGSEGVSAENLSKKIMETGGKKPVKIKVIRKGESKVINVKPIPADGTPLAWTVERDADLNRFVGRLERREATARGLGERARAEADERRARADAERERIQALAERLAGHKGDAEAMQKYAKELAALAEQMAADSRDQAEDAARRALELRVLPRVADGEQVLRWGVPMTPTTPPTPGFPGGLYRFESGDGEKIIELHERLEDMDEFFQHFDHKFEDFDHRFEDFHHHFDRVDELSDEFERINDRLDRIERMLERLLDDRR